MGALNIRNYTAEELAISSFARALAHPLRLRIIQYLLQNNYIRNVDACRCFSVSPSTIHKHFTILKENDLIFIEYANHCNYITLNFKTYEQLFKMIPEIEYIA